MQKSSLGLIDVSQSPGDLCRRGKVIYNKKAAQQLNIRQKLADLFE
jgi:hypothetical protein